MYSYIIVFFNIVFLVTKICILITLFTFGNYRAVLRNTISILSSRLARNLLLWILLIIECRYGASSIKIKCDKDVFANGSNNARINVDDRDLDTNERCTIRIHWLKHVLVAVSCVSFKYSYYSGRLELIELLDASSHSVVVVAVALREDRSISR